MRILITGGSGFIGSHLVDALDFSNTVTNFDIVNGLDVRDRVALTAAAAGQDIIIHCAAIAGIYRTAKDYGQTLDVNLNGTRNAIDAARAAGVRLFVDFSTSEVYGPMVFDGKEDDATTQGPLVEGRWAYAVSKLAGEYIVANSGLPWVSVRPFNVFGPGQIGEGAVREMVMRALTDAPITVYNDGTQIRSWCYIADFVDAILAIVHNPACRNKVYNIGNPQNTITALNLARMVVSMSGSHSLIEFRPHPGPEVNLRVPNIERARTDFGFAPSVTLEDGLRRTIEYYRSLL